MPRTAAGIGEHPPVAFARPRVARLAVDIAADWALIVLPCALLWTGPAPWTYPFVIVCIGIHQHRLAVLGHDGAHRLMARKRRVNDVLSNLLFFYPMTATVEGYRRWHFDHHSHVGTPDDPERPLKRGRLYSTPMAHTGFVAMGVGDLIGLGIRDVLVQSWLVRPPSARSLAGLAAYWVLVVAVTMSTGAWFVLGAYVASLFTSFWACSRVRNWSEHVGSAGTHRFTAHPLLRYVFFPHNTWCHFEHHRWPYVSYQYLPAARCFERATPIVSLAALTRAWRARPVGDLAVAATAMNGKAPPGSTGRPPRATE